jgi:hypothetical protein
MEIKSSLLYSQLPATTFYEGVSKSLRTESITKSTTTNTHWEVIQRVMAAKLTRLAHKIAIQLHIMQFSRQEASPETFGYTLV